MKDFTMKVIYQRFDFNVGGSFGGVYLEDGTFVCFLQEKERQGAFPKGNYVAAGGDWIEGEGGLKKWNFEVCDNLGEEPSYKKDFFSKGTEILIRDKDYLINPF